MDVQVDQQVKHTALCCRAVANKARSQHAQHKGKALPPRHAQPRVDDELDQNGRARFADAAWGEAAWNPWGVPPQGFGILGCAWVRGCGTLGTISACGDTHGVETHVLSRLSSMYVGFFVFYRIISYQTQKISYTSYKTSCVQALSQSQSKSHNPQPNNQSTDLPQWHPPRLGPHHRLYHCSHVLRPQLQP